MNLARGLFDAPVAHSLADEKIEALRRFSVRAWFRDFIQSKDMRAFFNAGYSNTNVLEILSHVGMSRGFIPMVGKDPSHIRRRRSTNCRCG